MSDDIELEEESPRGRATADAIRRGLAADRAPADFTERVMRRIALARPAGDPVPAGRQPPPMAVRRRRFAVAASIAWVAFFGIGALATDAPQAPPPAPVARTEARDPRAGWVRLDGLGGFDPVTAIILATGSMNGDYTCQAYYDGENPREWWVLAEPRPGTGGAYYLVEASGVIRSERDRVPDRKSPRLGS